MQFASCTVPQIWSFEVETNEFAKRGLFHSTGIKNTGNERVPNSHDPQRTINSPLVKCVTKKLNLDNKKKNAKMISSFLTRNMKFIMDVAKSNRIVHNVNKESGNKSNIFTGNEILSEISDSCLQKVNSETKNSYDSENSESQNPEEDDSLYSTHYFNFDNSVYEMDVGNSNCTEEDDQAKVETKEWEKSVRKYTRNKGRISFLVTRFGRTTVQL